MNRKKFYLIAGSLVISEILLTTAFKNVFGHYVSPIIYLFIGLTIGATLLVFGKDASLPPSSVAKDSTLKLTINWASFLFGLFFLWNLAIDLYVSYPVYKYDISKTGSDVIPQIMYFTDRFIDGKFPYDPIPIPELKYTLIPTYLPFQWLPYIPASIFGFDYRFIALSVCTIALLLYAIYVSKLNLGQLYKITLCILPIVYLIFYLKTASNGAGLTVEYNVAAYYLLLGIALYKRNVWGIGLGLLICILSRYSLVLWLPLLGIIGWYYLGAKSFFKVASIVLLGIGIFYLPFLIKNPYLFMDGYDYYAKASVGEWKIHDWQPTSDLAPYQLNQGMGFAIYAYDFLKGSLEYKIAIFQRLHLIMCVCSVCLLFLYWYKNRDRFAFEVFAIASLKIYLTIFYSFVVIPYTYLYVLPTLFSFIVLMIIGRLKNSKYYIT